MAVNTEVTNEFPMYLGLQTWWCHDDAALGDTMHSARLSSNASGRKAAVMVKVGEQDACDFIIKGNRWALKDLITPVQHPTHPFPWAAQVVEARPVGEPTDSEGGEP